MRNLFLINYRFCLFENVKSRQRFKDGKDETSRRYPVEAKLFDKLNIIACVNTYRENEGRGKEEKDEERKKIRKRKKKVKKERERK